MCQKGVFMAQWGSMGVLLGSISLSWSPWGLSRDQWRLVRLNRGPLGAIGAQWASVYWCSMGILVAS